MKYECKKGFFLIQKLKNYKLLKTIIREASLILKFLLDSQPLIGWSSNKNRTKY